MPEPDPPISEHDLADLAALADGRLAPARAAELQARMAAEPALAAEYVRQRRAVSLVRVAVADVDAPLALRERIHSQSAHQRRRSRRRWQPFAAAATVLGVALVALVVALGGAGAPSVTDTLLAAAQPAAIGVPVDPDTPQLLALQRGGVPFPNFLAKFGWEATGARTDTIGDRPTTTVFYEKDGQEISYTIVDGEALDVPAGETTTVGDTTFTLIEADGRTVITWERGGRTCVLSGKGVPADDLLELAGWKGKGAVPF